MAIMWWRWILEESTAVERWLEWEFGITINPPVRIHSSIDNLRIGYAIDKYWFWTNSNKFEQILTFTFYFQSLLIEYATTIDLCRRQPPRYTSYHCGCGRYSRVCSIGLGWKINLHGGQLECLHGTEKSPWKCRLRLWTNDLVWNSTRRTEQHEAQYKERR